MRLMWMVLCWARARADKEATYPELLSGRCRLVVMAIETGGRWSSEAVDFVRQLAFPKAREVPSHMRFPIALVWERRWIDCVFPRFCLVPGGTFRQVCNLVLDKWRATVCGGIARARSAVVACARAVWSLLLVE